MILGGEQPVALPTMSWYDKDAFKMYIAAVKDDYDKNLEEQKDFLDKYIDIAATDPDRKYMADNVINPVVNFVNNNPNAIRSVEGRMMMRQLRNAINPEAIGRIKATAKIADTYNKAMAQMMADGTYSEDMQKMMGSYLKDWDSATNGAFQQAAPYKIDDVEKVLMPTIESLRKAYRYDDKLTKEKNDGYRYRTVSPDQITGAMNNAYMDIMSRPGMQYHMKKFLQENPGKTEQDWKNKLIKQVSDQLGEESEWDKLAEEKRDRAFQASEKAKDRALSRELAEEKRKQEQSTKLPIGWTMSTLDQSMEKLGAGVGNKNDPRAVTAHALMTKTAKGLGYVLRKEYSTWATYLRNNGVDNCFTGNKYFDPRKVSNKNAIHNLTAIHVDQRQLARSIGASGSVSQTQKDGDNSQSRTIQATSVTIPYSQLYRIYNDDEMKRLHIYSSRRIPKKGAVVGRNGTFKDLNESYAGTGENPTLIVTFTPSAVGNNYTHQIAHDGKMHVYIKGTVRVSGQDGGSIKTHGFFSRNIKPYQRERWYDAGEYNPAVGIDGSPNVNVQAIDSQIANDYNQGIKSVEGGYGTPFPLQ